MNTQIIKEKLISLRKSNIDIQREIKRIFNMRAEGKFGKELKNDSDGVIVSYAPLSFGML